MFKIKGGATLLTKILSVMRDEVDEKNESITKQLLKDMVAATPVDTGYARSRWAYNSNDGFGYKITYSPSIIKRIFSSSTPYKLFPVEYVLTNDADYIIYLNRGHSKQAAPFFIENVILRNGFKIKEPVNQKP